MGVRGLRESDLPEVANLHHRVTGESPWTPGLDAAYERWFSEVFFRDPRSATTEGVEPLVHTDERGVIDGFLGVSARRMRMGSRSYLAALSSQFVVAPEARSKLVAFQLLRSLLTGPQDLSIADGANEHSARLWRALGGVSSHLYGTHWIRALRPMSLGAAIGARRRRAVALARPLASPVTRALDEVLLRVPGPHRPAAPAGIRAEPLTPEAFIEHAPRFCERDALVPDHDVASLRWALSRATDLGRGAPLECSLVRAADGEPLGLYVATLPAGELATALHVAASERGQEPVVRYLVHRAFRRGSVSIGGRVHPPLMRALSTAFALFHARSTHMLIQARRPELIEAFDRGVATFSHLDGEWCIRFLPSDDVDPRAERGGDRPWRGRALRDRPPRDVASPRPTERAVRVLQPRST